MPLWYFMSYAHSDAEDRERALVREFHQDLAKAIASRADNTKAESAGFFDQFNIEWGDEWPGVLAEATRTCRTFVPIMTASYFNSDYCGREWAAFAKRTAHSLNSAKTSRLILPILWVKPVESKLPEMATDLQFAPSLDEVPEEEERRRLEVFQSKGLEYVAKRKGSNYSSTYDTLVEQLATRIIKNAVAHELPALPEAELPSLKAVESPFRKPAAPAAAPADAPASSTARFVVVAACAAEVEPGPRAPHYDAEPRRWRPFFPDKKPVGLIAQAQAGERDLFCDWLPVDDQLIEKLRQAEERKSVAIMLIDPWTAQRSPYKEKLQQFDQFLFSNLVIIVVWNIVDKGNEAALRAGLEEALERRFKLAQPAFLREAGSDPAELEAAIRGALDDLESILAPKRQPVRAVAAAEITTPPSIGPNKGLDT